MEISQIPAAISTAATVLKTILGLRDATTDVQRKQELTDLINHVIDLQSTILALQTERHHQANIEIELKEKIKQYEQWDAEAARYELHQIAHGILVYALKPDNQRAEPSHWLCPNCFQSRKKSILCRPGIDYANYKCHACPFNIIPESTVGANFKVVEVG